MKEDKRVLSFRFKEHILKKIDYLVEENRKQMEELGVTPKTRTQIVEDIIQDYYLRSINENRDPDLKERIAIMVDDAADARFKSIKGAIDEILFYAVKNDLGNKVFYEHSDAMPDPGNRHKALGMIGEKDTIWDETLNDYLKDRWNRILADIHYTGGRPR